MIALLALLGLPGFDLIEHERPRVLRLAEASLRAEPRTIVEVVNPRSAGGRHDFSSEGDYWWPNPDDPDGPYIRRDGETNPANFVAHRQLLFAFARQVGDLGAAYRVTGDDRFAAAAARHLRAWLVDPGTRMNPNLRYAQSIHGVVDGRGIGIIDTVHLAEVALAVKALRGAADVSAELDAGVTTWFRDYLEWIRTHPQGIEERDTQNNHATCWVLQAAAYARVTGNAAVLAECRDRFRNILLPRQMGADGSFPRETSRTKPYGYSIFNLDVMCGVAVLLSQPGEDLMHYALPDGRSLLRGVAWLAPHLEDKATWPFPRDVMYWDDWPVRQPALLFGALSAGRQDWLELWRRLEPDPVMDEVQRNFPIRHPVLWLD